MRRPPALPDTATPGFQIAPMIDVVFVIMLFFVAMAASIKEEHRLSSTLPGCQIPDPQHQEPPTEISIGIAEDGEVSLNDLIKAGDGKCLFRDEGFCIASVRLILQFLQTCSNHSTTKNKLRQKDKISYTRDFQPRSS